MKLNYGFQSPDEVRLYPSLADLKLYLYFHNAQIKGYVVKVRDPNSGIIIGFRISLANFLDMVSHLLSHFVPKGGTEA